MNNKVNSLQKGKKEWTPPTCKCFGNVQDLTLRSGKEEPIDPHTGRPIMGIKCIS